MTDPQKLCDLYGLSCVVAVFVVDAVVVVAVVVFVLLPLTRMPHCCSLYCPQPLQKTMKTMKRTLKRRMAMTLIAYLEEYIHWLYPRQKC